MKERESSKNTKGCVTRNKGRMTNIFQNLIEKCFFLLPSKNTLDEYLWQPLNFIVEAPKDTFVWWMFINSIFVVFGELNWTISHYFTNYGLFFTYMGLLYCLALLITRSISFPMSNSYALRSMESEIAREQKKTIVKSLSYFRSYFHLIVTYQTNIQQQHNIKTRYFTKSVKDCESGKSTIIHPLILCLKSFHKKLTTSNNVNESNKNDIILNLITGLNSLVEGFELVKNIEVVTEENKRKYVKTLLKVELLSIFLDKYDIKKEEEVLKLINELEKCLSMSEMESFCKKYKKELDFVYNPSKKTCNCENCKQKAMEDGNINEIETDDSPLLNLKSDDEKQSVTYQIFTKCYELFQDWRKSYKPIDAILSIDYFRSSLDVVFDCYELTLPLHDKQSLNGVLIYGKKKDISLPNLNKPKTLGELSSLVKQKRLIIICNPNAAVYEYAQLQYEFMNYYLENDISVLLFNFRGYAKSTGYPTPTVNCKDALSLVKYLVDMDLAIPGRIAVHALSIGGIMAAVLASKAEEIGISLMIFDRNFSSLADTAAALIHPITKYPLRDVLGWEGNNIPYFLQGTGIRFSLNEDCMIRNRSNSVTFIVACDPNDEIIHNEASIKAGAARAIMENALFNKPLGFSHLAKCRENLMTCKKKEGQVDNEKFVLAQPTFPIVFVTNLISLQTKLQSLLSARNLSTSNKQAYTVLANAFQSFVSMKVCGQPLKEALQNFLLDYELDELDAVRTKLIEKKTRMEANAISDWFYCLLIWQPRVKLKDDKNSQNFEDIINAVALSLRRLKVNEIDALDALKVSDEVIFFESLWTSLNDFYKLQTVDTNLHLIPLTCGHNNSFKSKEWSTLVSLLEETGWCGSK